LEKVILILIDGCRVDTLAAVGTPNIDRIMAQGAWTLDARTVTPSITLPVHVSMFTGMAPRDHGVMTNTAVPEYSRSCLSLFQWAKHHGRTTAMYYNWEFLRRLSPPGCLAHSVYLDCARQSGGDMAVARAAVEGIHKCEPDFTFVYFGCLDEAGHAHGYESKAYEKTLMDADAAVGYLLDTLDFDTSNQNGGTTRPYTVFFQSDHGGFGFDHDHACPQVMTIPWMVSGPGIRPGQINSKENVTVLHTFPAIAHCMDLPCPDQCSGGLKSACNIFRPGKS